MRCCLISLDLLLTTSLPASVLRLQSVNSLTITVLATLILACRYIAFQQPLARRALLPMDLGRLAMHSFQARSFTLRDRAPTMSKTRRNRWKRHGSDG